MEGYTLVVVDNCTECRAVALEIEKMNVPVQEQDLDVYNHAKNTCLLIVPALALNGNLLAYGKEDILNYLIKTASNKKAS